MRSKLHSARRAFHERLGEGLLTVDDNGVPSFCDKDNKLSVKIGKLLVEKLPSHALGTRLAGQTAGNEFEKICAEFLAATWPLMSQVRPGEWLVERVTERSGDVLSRFDQYAHLAELKSLLQELKILKTIIGNDYSISPDVIVARLPVQDSEFATDDRAVVDNELARLSPLRVVNQQRPLLHASISCKWTIRSDRAQNSRAEALNMIRNRKGNLPHIKIVTAEPLPSRIQSIALGTGDIDCVYHVALPEMILAVEEAGEDDSNEMLSTLVQGRRLRDISDLPLDLAV